MHRDDDARLQQRDHRARPGGVERIGAADGDEQHVRRADGRAGRRVRLMAQIAQMDDPKAIHFNRIHDIRPALLPPGVVVKRGDAGDRYAANRVLSGRADGLRGTGGGSKKVVIVVCVAARHGVGLDVFQPVARGGRARIGQDPHPIAAREQEAGMAVPFQNHRNPSNRLNRMDSA